MTDDQTLRAVAEAATPGPWTYCAPDQDGSVYVDRAGDHEQSICMVMSPSPHERDIADGKFISTFDPPTVLSLLDRLAVAEARATTARADGLREIDPAAITAAIESAEIGYSLRLTRLIDGESTYTLTYSDGAGPFEFDDISDGHEHIRQRKRQVQADAVLAAIRERAASVGAGSEPPRSAGRG